MSFSLASGESIKLIWDPNTEADLAVQHIEPGVDHVQAEKFDKNPKTGALEWIPLTPVWDHDYDRIKVIEYRRHFEVEPYRYLTLREWIDEQIQFTEVKE